MCLGLEEPHAAAEDTSLAVGNDPHGREEDARHDRPVVADLLLAGVEDEVGGFADRPVPPGTVLLVEFRRSATHLRRGDVEAAELLDDGRDLLGADALDAHLGDGEVRSPSAADASLERPWVERPSVLVAVSKGLGLCRSALPTWVLRIFRHNPLA